MIGRRRAHGRDRETGERERGQSLVEFSMIITVVMLLLLGMLEFGFLFDHHLTLEYATREGARVGSAMANTAGGAPVPCTALGDESVDKEIVAAVQRVITSPGSAVVASRITEIRIYRSTATGGVDGSLSNKWIYSKLNGPLVDGVKLDFVTSGATGWQACKRWNSSGLNPLTGLTGPESIGVSLKYSYQLVTPLSAAMGFFGTGNTPSTIPIGDHTVMSLNPGK